MSGQALRLLPLGNLDSRYSLHCLQRDDPRKRSQRKCCPKCSPTHAQGTRTTQERILLHICWIHQQKKNNLIRRGPSCQSSHFSEGDIHKIWSGQAPHLLPLSNIDSRYSRHCLRRDDPRKRSPRNCYPKCNPHHAQGTSTMQEQNK